MLPEPQLPEIARRLQEPPMLDGYTLHRTNYPPPVFVIEELLANGLTILAGRPKCGKSWLTLQMAIDAATGKPFLGRFAVGAAMAVLYCGLEEGPGRTHNRLRKLVPTLDIQLQNIAFRYNLKTLANGGAEELAGLIREGRFGLVVIDTFMRLVQPNGSRDVFRSEYAEVNQLRELAERFKIAIVLVHHTRKASAESGLDAVAGSTGITAACDAVWTLKRQPGGGESILEVTGREMEEVSLGLRMEKGEPFGWQVTGEGVEVGMSEARLEIVELLRDEGSLKPARVADMLKKNAVTVRRLLQKLAADGVVCKDSSDRYYLASQREQRERVNGVNE